MDAEIAACSKLKQADHSFMTLQQIQNQKRNCNSGPVASHMGEHSHTSKRSISPQSQSCSDISVAQPGRNELHESLPVDAKERLACPLTSHRVSNTGSCCFLPDVHIDHFETYNHGKNNQGKISSVEFSRILPVKVFKWSALETSETSRSGLEALSKYLCVTFELSAEVRNINI